MWNVVCICSDAHDLIDSTRNFQRVAKENDIGELWHLVFFLFLPFWSHVVHYYFLIIINEMDTGIPSVWLHNLMTFRNTIHLFTFLFCCFSPVALPLLYCNFDDDDAMLCDVSRWQSQKRRAAAHGRPFFLFIIFNYNLLCFSAICRVVVVMLVSDCVRLSHSVLNRAGQTLQIVPPTLKRTVRLCISNKEEQVEIIQTAAVGKVQVGRGYILSYGTGQSVLSYGEGGNKE